jgi:hypothetical protein
LQQGQRVERTCLRGPASRFDRVGKIAHRCCQYRADTAGDFAHPMECTPWGGQVGGLRIG